MKIVPIAGKYQLVNVEYAAEEVLNTTADIFVKDARKFHNYAHVYDDRERSTWYNAFECYSTMIAAFLRLKPIEQAKDSTIWRVQDVLERQLIDTRGRNWYYDLVVSHFIINYSDGTQLKIQDASI